jgi:probable HAF family extracellular repeat protein
MRTRHCLSILVLGLWMLSLLVPTIPWAAQSYTVQDLNIEDAVKAVGPNVSGQTVVRSGFVSARSFALRPGAAVDDLGVLSSGAPAAVRSPGLLPGGDHTTVNGINDAGAVVGSTNTSFGSRPCRADIPGLPPPGSCPISAVHAVIWTKAGALRDIGTLPGDTASEAFGINNAGTVVGYSSGPTGARAFVWSGGTMQNLGTLPGGDFSKAFGISDNGLIVGSSGSPAGTRAVLWSSSGIQDLGTLSGDTASEAFAINNLGNIVGYSRGPAGMRAFLWTSQNAMQSLPALSAGSITRAFGLNAAGQVVGSAGNDAGSRAVLWSAKGEAQDLNTLVSLPPGVTLLSAVGINARGQILALARDIKDSHGFHEGSNRVFLLTP